MIMKMIYANAHSILSTIIQKSKHVNEQDLKRLETLTTEVKFFTDAVNFLRLLNDAFVPMKDLLQSVAFGDVQEAVAFFVAAYQFNLDGAPEGAIGECYFVGKSGGYMSSYYLVTMVTVWLLNN